MTRLYDSLLAGAACLHANGDNAGRAPTLVRWQREGEPGINAWFTDSNLRDAESVQAQHKVAWILEPRDYRASAYEYVERNKKVFNKILSFDQDMLRRGVALPYMFGGTRIAPQDWSADYHKVALVSIVASPKRTTTGHRLRHEVISKTKIDAYGPEYRPLDRKIFALAPYQFTVAIEASRLNWWFTETLLDCFLTGTVPIYWGCPSIGKLFNANGIIQVEDFSDIKDAVNTINPIMYEHMRPAIQENFWKAQEYHMTEDWLQHHYPDLFDEVEGCG